ncbi:FG-GAP-like repeat-containing protein [Streptomyces sp. NBC_00102]|uniref:FG-GAP-like repeat-containing protein n=1 Tax=Streptomyces sp. NBC_00102 TaxID=2975652 RepID=UPI00224D0ADA|nr:FG-GAP-like repeat-containing protein [Streptomyces sp. NBC_00102]MCX5397483.1 FG-GAP-like repeat-containing protein [Streptomyces sp. NBC_00102]
MERRRPSRATVRRTAAGVAALVAAGLGFAMLGPAPDDPVRQSATPVSPATAPLDESGAQKQAIRTGKRVEVTALRDATSTTFALPNGSFELTASAAPVRAKVDGAWKPLDSTLARTKNGWAPRVASDPVVFSDGSGSTGGAAGGSTGKGSAHTASFTVTRGSGSGSSTRGLTASDSDDDTGYHDLVTLNSGGHLVTMGWPGDLPEPEIDGATALYRGVLDGVDLLLTARDSGFTHVLVVRDAAAAEGLRRAGLSYRLSSPDLSFHLDPITHAVTALDSTGAELAVSPTPYLWDSAGHPAVTEGADPQPAEPTEEPAPAYSEEPGEELTEAPADSEAPDTDDTAAPEDDGVAPEDGDATPSNSATPEPEESLDGSDARSTDGIEQSVYHSGAVTPASLRDAIPATTFAEVLGLPGLAGPQVGAKTALGKAALTGEGSGTATLDIVPDESLLTDPDTTWPVFIDPSITGKTKNWTTTYKKYPTSSFYDGANYNTGTTEGRAGYESTTGGLSRSFFRLGWTSSIKGATVTKAEIRLMETYAWSCTAREMQVWHTGGISSKTTWNNQPAWSSLIGAKSFANGWSSACPDAYVVYDGKSVAQSSANSGATEITIGLQATNEDSATSWKKFKAEGESAPKITITYNRKPAEPTKLDITPGTGCDTVSPYPSIGLSDVTLSAKSSDPDGDLKYLNFAVWQSGSTTRLYDGNRTVDSTGAASVTIDGADGTASEFTNGKTYFWAVRALDATGSSSTYGPPSTANCGLVYDSSAPNSPDVTSTDFPEDDGNASTWSKVPFGTAGNFTFSPAGSTDTVKYMYSFNSTALNNSVTVAAGASATVALKPLTAGPSVLYVKAVDSAGNTSSSPTMYVHYVTPRDSKDAAGDVTGDKAADLYLLDGTGDLRLYPATFSGDIHTSLVGAYKHGVSLEDDLDEDGVSDYGTYWLAKDGKPALITHNGDFLPGDGVQDLVARMPDGKVYIYRGDGYGSVDIDRRTEVRFPSNAPDPSTFTQILAAGDITGDGRPDMLATAGATFWAFSGYTGGTFQTATQLAGASWDVRDLVNIGDVNKDGAADLLYRTFASNRLLLRLGKPDGAGGTVLASLAYADASLSGVDAEYATGWSATAYPLMTGTADVSQDGIPDIWALAADGTVKFFKGGATTLGAPVTVISGGWSGKKAMG